MTFAESRQNNLLLFLPITTGYIVQFRTHTNKILSVVLYGVKHYILHYGKRVTVSENNVLDNISGFKKKETADS
jgi:hypothetical protein